MGDVGDDARSLKNKLLCHRSDTCHCYTGYLTITVRKWPRTVNVRYPVLSLTIAPGHWVAPATVRLTDGSVAGPRECHPLLTSATQRHVTWGHVDTWASHLKVTTAWSVVLLPSSQPLGRMPGEPQLISEKRQ